MGNLEQMITFPNSWMQSWKRNGGGTRRHRSNQGQAIRETALFCVHQRTRYLLAQMAVGDGCLALDLVEETMSNGQGGSWTAPAPPWARCVRGDRGEAMTNQQLRFWARLPRSMNRDHHSTSTVHAARRTSGSIGKPPVPPSTLEQRTACLQRHIYDHNGRWTGSKLEKTLS
jgi:hypothetical protein